MEVEAEKQPIGAIYANADTENPWSDRERRLASAVTTLNSEQMHSTHRIH